MIDWTVYDVATGEVRICVNSSAEDAALQVADGEGIIEGVYPRRIYYLPEGAPTLRPVAVPNFLSDIDAAVGDVVTLFSDLPAGTRVIVASDQIVETTMTEDGPLELEISAVGVYRVDITPPFPWQQIAPILVRATL